MEKKSQIKVKDSSEIEILREAGSILSRITEELKCSLNIGIKTVDIDFLAEKLIKKFDVKPAFKGYRGYPATTCISVNQQVVHGIPGNRVVEEGDIVSIDIGIIHKGYFSDMAVTLGVGDIGEKLQKLINITEQSLYKGISQAVVGNHLSDISHAIQTFAEENGFSVVRDFVGHGIGAALHEDPEIPNFGPPHCGPVLKSGMVFAIEPMVNMGGAQTRILDDGWTVVTKDSAPSAHFEHSVLISDDGPEVLTKIINGVES